MGPRDLHFNQVSQEILFFFLFFNFWLCWIFIAAGAFLTAVHELLIAVGSLVGKHRL